MGKYKALYFAIVIIVNAIIIWGLQMIKFLFIIFVICAIFDILAILSNMKR